MSFTPICVPIFLMTDNRENGSTIRFDIDSSGKNCVMFSAILLSGKILKVRIPLATPSIIFHTNKKPMANAERFTKIPRNKQNEKNPTNFTKKAKIYSKSENTIPNSV